MAEKDPGKQRIVNHPVLEPLPERELVNVLVDGREISGYAGESIAATLLAHGIRMFRTMPDTHQPRGYFSGVGRSSDEVMMVDDEINVMVTNRVLESGMKIETQQGLGEWRETK